MDLLISSDVDVVLEDEFDELIDNDNEEQLDGLVGLLLLFF